MKYRVEGGVAQFAAGTKLKLTKEQVSARAHLLEDAGGGFCQSAALLTFKAGEVLEIAGPFEKLPRNLQVVLVPANSKKASEKPKPATAKNPTTRKKRSRAKPAGSDAPVSDPGQGASQAPEGPQPFAGGAAAS